jgi:homocysteine S-methyltransferase
VEPDEARAAFFEQAEGLLEGGVDAFIVETFSDPVEMQQAVLAIRALTDLPIVAQVAFTDDGVTFFGRAPAAVVRALRELPIQAVGANCSVGSSTLYDILEQMLPEAGELPVVIQPNAGLPSRMGERLVYLSSPAYMADYAARMVTAGARMVGGCCGTTPQHVRAMREALDRLVPGRTAARVVSVRRVRAETPDLPSLTTTAAPTAVQRKLDAGEFLVTVELDPPRGHNIEKLVQGAKLLKERGVEIVDINDGSLGRVRMSVLPTAILVREATGLDINMHFTCRDRNLMGIQADVLGAHAVDIRNILAMTGDPPRTGDYVNATAVFDVDAIGLIRILAGMNRGLDATGNSIGEPTSFCVGIALNPAAAEPAREMERFLAKVEAGARWAQTQPVYDLEVLERFFGSTRPPIPVVVGLLPLHSSRHAEFLHNEVPGITVPDAVRARMREAGSGDCAWGSRPLRSSSRMCAAGTPAPTSCRRSAASRWSPRCSKPFGEDRSPLPDLLATLGRAASPEAGFARTLRQLVTLSGATCGGLVFRPRRGASLTVTAGARRGSALDRWLRERLAEPVRGVRREAVADPPSGWRAGKPVLLRAPLGEPASPLGQFVLLGPVAAVGSPPTRSRRASRASSAGPWSRSGGCTSGRSPRGDQRGDRPQRAHRSPPSTSTTPWPRRWAGSCASTRSASPCSTASATRCASSTWPRVPGCRRGATCASPRRYARSLGGGAPDSLDGWTTCRIPRFRREPGDLVAAGHRSAIVVPSSRRAT